MGKWQSRAFISLGSFVFFLVLLEAALRLGGYFYLQKIFPRMTPGRQGSSPVTVLCVGDSYTVGGAGDWEDSYPIQLQGLLEARVPGRYTVINGGICEANTTQVLEHLSRLIKAYKVDKVVFLAGATNRFNLVGYHQNNFWDMFFRLRIYKMARILKVNFLGRALQRLAGQKLQQRQLTSREYGYDVKGQVRPAADICGEDEEDTLRADAEQSPRDTQAQYRLADCYLRQRKFDQSRQVYQNIVAGGQDVARAYRELGVYYQGQKQFAEADAAFRGLIAAMPNDVWPYGEAANNYLRQGKYAEAIKVLQPALALDRKVADLYVELALLYAKQGNFDEALGMLLQAVALDPDNQSLFYFLLKVHHLQSRYDARAVREFLEQLQDRQPDLKRDEVFQNYMGLFADIERMQGQTDAWLRRDLEKAVQLCAENGIELIVANYPYPYHDANRFLQAVAEKNGLPFVDHYAVFRGLRPRDRYLQDTDHCTVDGHRVMAENVLNILMPEERR